MARRFRGESIHRVDGKGRVSIPAPFRRVLQDNDPEWAEGLAPNLVIVYGNERRKFLEGFSVAAMADVDERIEALPRGSRERRILERTFQGQAHPTQVDETGRLVLPQKLRDKIAITEEAIFVGAGDTFQIWAPDAYNANQSEIDGWLDDYDDDFDALALLERGARPTEG